MLDQIWMGITEVVTRPELSGLATAFVAMFTFVASWKFVPEFLRDVRPLQQEQSGMPFVRTVIALGLIGGLTLASVAMMRLLPQI